MRDKANMTALTRARFAARARKRAEYHERAAAGSVETIHVAGKHREAAIAERALECALMVTPAKRKEEIPNLAVACPRTPPSPAGWRAVEATENAQRTMCWRNEADSLVNRVERDRAISKAQMYERHVMIVLRAKTAKEAMDTIDKGPWS